MTQIPPQTATNQGLSDAVLLRRFALDADEAAFAMIVERHAGLVMSVCRRVVGQTADCDDAFQATFYALSQRPESIRECRSLTGWLYSVAWRTSIRLIRLRKKSKMESLPDQISASEPDPLDRIAEANDLAALDAELHQLPEKYRHVLVMSYFAHQTNQEIADQLNESKGTIDGRIREARRMLRVRLARRGVEVGALLVAGSLVQSASAAVPSHLIASTIQFSKLSSGFSSAMNISGIDMNQMQALSSTGTTVMGIKAGTFLASGALMLTGMFGLSQLLAWPGDGDPFGGDSKIARDIADQESATAIEPVAEIEPALTASAEAPDESSADLKNQEVAAGSQSASSGSLGNRPEDDAGNNGGTVRTTQPPVGSGGLSGPGGGLSGGLSGAGRGIGGVSGDGQSSGIGMIGGLGSMGMGESAGMGIGMEGSSGMGIASGGGPAKPKGSAAMAEFSRAGSRKAQEQLHTKMYSSKVPAIEFGDGASLRDVLGLLSTHLSVSFMVDETDEELGGNSAFLENTLISPISVSEGSMTVASALNIVLDKVQETELTWIVENETILITTVASSESVDRAFIRSYDVKKLRLIYETMVSSMPDDRALSGSPGGMAGMGGSGMSSAGNAGVTSRITWQKCLMADIENLTTPLVLWVSGEAEYGTMSVVGDRLIVQQNRTGHEKVVEVLEELELATETQGQN